MPGLDRLTAPGSRYVTNPPQTATLGAMDTTRIRQLLDSAAEAARLSPPAREMLEGIRHAGQVERRREGPQSYGTAGYAAGRSMSNW